MLTAMLIPAKRRLLLPRMEASALLGAWGGDGAGGSAGPAGWPAPQCCRRRGCGGRGGAGAGPKVGHASPHCSSHAHQYRKDQEPLTHLLLPGAPDARHRLMEPVDGFPAWGEGGGGSVSLGGGGTLGEEARARRVWGSDATGSQEGGKLGLLERGGRDRALDQGYWPPPRACLQTPPHTHTHTPHPWLSPSGPSLLSDQRIPGPQPNVRPQHADRG